jgi:hypothetical protein
MLEGWRATIRSETWQKLSQDTEFLFDLVDDHPGIRLLIGSLCTALRPMGRVADNCQV